MKMIIAVVRPFLLEKLVVELEDIEDFPGMTVTDSEGFGQRIKSPDDALRPLKPNKRIEIVCDDELVEKVVDVIREHAHTGRKGDGIIMILSLDELSRI